MRLMRFENTIPITTFILVVSIYLYFVSLFSANNVITTFGPLLSIIIFGITMLLLVFAARRMKWKNASSFYLGLFVLSIFILLMHILSFVNVYIQLFYVVVILIALFLALLDIRTYLYGMKKLAKKYNEKKEAVDKEVTKLNSEKKNYELKIQELNQKIGIISEKNTDAQKEKRNLLKEINSMKRRVANAKKAISSKTTALESLKKRIDSSTKRNKQLKELEAQNLKLGRELSRKEKDLVKQVDLKQKYSKSLSTIKRKKKEEEELLVVSNDGKSVHKPKCIIVRSIPQDNRKLIANWKLANKEGYKGCGLCKPHIKPTFVIKNGVKYKFVAAESSDKVHVASCVLSKNIDSKEKRYFKSYKAALKKGFTACRVCMPRQ